MALEDTIARAEAMIAAYRDSKPATASAGTTPTPQNVIPISADYSAYEPTAPTLQPKDLEIKESTGVPTTGETRYRDNLNAFMQYMQSSPYAAFDQDLVKGTPETNTNERSSPETTRYQRLVDYMNGKVYTVPADIGARGHGKGGSQSQAIGMPTTRQMPKLETEETRQQALKRESEKQVRERGISRQQDYKDYELAMEAKWQLEMLRQAGSLSNEELRRYGAFIDEQIHEIRMRTDTKYRAAFENFSQRLAASVKGELYNKLIAIYKDPNGGAALATLFGGMVMGGTMPAPTMDQFLTGAMGARILGDAQSGKLTDVEALQLFYQTNVQAATTMIAELARSEVPALAAYGQEAWAYVQQMLGGTP
jgi:hypothetical protein